MVDGLVAGHAALALGQLDAGVGEEVLAADHRGLLHLEEGELGVREKVAVSAKKAASR